MVTAVTANAPSPPGRAAAGLGLMVLLMVGVVVAGMASGGELLHVASAGVLFVPAIVLAALSQAGDQYRWLRVVEWVWFWCVLLAVGVLTVGLVFAASAAGGQAAAATAFVALELAALLAVVVVLLVTGSWRWLGTRLAAAPLPDRAIDAQAVAGLIFLTGAAFCQLAALGGMPPLLELIRRGELGGDAAPLDRPGDAVYQALWMVVLAILGAGYPVRRAFADGLVRLGVRRLPRGVVARLVVVGLGLALLAPAADRGLAWVWSALGWQQTNGELVDQLFAAGHSPLGVVVLAVCAGVSEEAIFRGLLQPRLGWLLPNLAFAAGHAFQYGSEALVSVFVFGAAMAFVRHRTSTTGAMLTHGLYDGILLGAALLGLPYFN